jgi:hypothetical protein
MKKQFQHRVNAVHGFILGVLEEDEAQVEAIEYEKK